LALLASLVAKLAIEVEVENGTPTYETRRLVPISALGSETKPVGSARRVIPARKPNDVTESNGGRSYN
jgi:hypothetical protein